MTAERPDFDRLDESWEQLGTAAYDELGAAYPSIRSYIKELEAEIARHHRDFERWEEMADKGASFIERHRRLRAALERIVDERIEFASDTAHDALAADKEAERDG